MISVSSSQLVTRNIVTVNYADAWVKWWMIFIKCLYNILYKWFSISSHVKYSAHMLDTRVGSPLLRGWYGSRSTSSHEHALYSSEMKWYDFLKLVKTEDLLIRVLFKIQWRDQHVIALHVFINDWFIIMNIDISSKW